MTANNSRNSEWYRRYRLQLHENAALRKECDEAIRRRDEMAAELQNERMLLQVERRKYGELVQRCKEAGDALERESQALGAAEAEVGRLERALRAVEWCNPVPPPHFRFNGQCPLCHKLQEHGHAESCLIGQALPGEKGENENWK